MRILILLCFGVLAVAMPGAALAQNDDAATRTALAERLIDVLARENLEKVLGDMVDQQAATLSHATEEQRAWYTANALPILEPHLQAMIDGMEARYAELFTLAELRALVAFYETPEGRAIAEKQNLVGAEMGAQTMAMASAYVADLVGKFCLRFECAPTADGQAMSGKAE